MATIARFLGRWNATFVRNGQRFWFIDSTARDEAGGQNVRDLARVSESVCRQLARADLEPRLGALRAPVLALAGDSDGLTAPVLERLTDIPRLTHATLPRCGHVPMVERPDELMAHLKPFLESII